MLNSEHRTTGFWSHDPRNSPNTHPGRVSEADDLSILGFLPEQQPVLLQKEDSLPVLPEIELALTVNQVFGWLKMGG